MAGSHCREAPSAGWHTENPLKAPTEPCRAMPADIVGGSGVSHGIKNRSAKGTAKTSQSFARRGSSEGRLESVCRVVVVGGLSGVCPRRSKMIGGLGTAVVGKREKAAVLLVRGGETGCLDGTTGLVGLDWPNSGSSDLAEAVGVREAGDLALVEGAKVRFRGLSWFFWWGGEGATAAVSNATKVKCSTNRGSSGASVSAQQVS